MRRDQHASCVNAIDAVQFRSMPTMPTMPTMPNVLFICSQNRLRSPTAEQVFSSRTDIECSSAGLNHDAENPVTSELLAWADLIFVMEKAHRTRLRSKFKSHLSGARVICLDIPDDHEYMDPELVRALKRKVDPYLPSPPPD